MACSKPAASLCFFPALPFPPALQSCWPWGPPPRCRPPPPPPQPPPPPPPPPPPLVPPRHPAPPPQACPAPPTPPPAPPPPRPARPKRRQRRPLQPRRRCLWRRFRRWGTTCCCWTYTWARRSLSCRSANRGARARRGSHWCLGKRRAIVCSLAFAHLSAQGCWCPETSACFANCGRSTCSLEIDLGRLELSNSVGWRAAEQPGWQTLVDTTKVRRTGRDTATLALLLLALCARTPE